MLVYDWYSGRLIILSPDPFHPLGFFSGGIETLGAVNCGFAVASPTIQPSIPQPQLMGSCGNREENGEDMKDKSKEAKEDFSINSNQEGPQSAANMLFSSSSSLCEPLSLSCQQQENLPSPPRQGFWRPWEDLTPAPRSFNAKPCLSPISPVHPQERQISRARRRRRSPGDLAKRKQRLLTYQYNQAHLFPHTPEPEESSLESGSWVGGPLRLDWSGIEYQPSPQTWWPSSTSCMSSPSPAPPTPPQTWWPSSTGWMSSPSPAPPPPASWMSSNLAPPSSPAYCDGCQRWGNLLSVTVSQSRGI